MCMNRPRLQDIVDPKAFDDMEIVADFGYWFDPNQELTPEMRGALTKPRWRCSYRCSTRYRRHVLVRNEPQLRSLRVCRP